MRGGRSSTYPSLGPLPITKGTSLASLSDFFKAASRRCGERLINGMPFLAAGEGGVFLIYAVKSLVKKEHFAQIQILKKIPCGKCPQGKKSNMMLNAPYAGITRIRLKGSAVAISAARGRSTPVLNCGRMDPCPVSV